MSPFAGSSRRELLAGAVATAGALLLDGCGTMTTTVVLDSHPATPTQRPSREAADGDLPILAAALELERHTIAAYTAGIPLMDVARARWMKAFLTEELEHAGELIALIRLAGGTARRPTADYAIGHPHDGDGVITVVEGLEDRQLAGYARWIPRLSAGTMRAGAASIFANDAQHITALRAARGAPPLGSAFVVGAPGGAASS